MNGIGIDVSKACLDVAVHEGATAHFNNTAAGHRKLLAWLTKFDVRQVVLEATGGYEQAILDALFEAGFPAARVNARQARDFARATGQLAKTDRLDAANLARMAQTLDLQRYHPCEPWQRRLREFVRARRQRVDAINTARLQLAQVSDRILKKQLQSSISQLEKTRAALDRQIAEQVEQQPHLAVLKTLKGVGPVLQAVIASYLPELGHVDGKAISKLVGVAPLSRDSGTMRGTRSIWGGRAEVRNVLYMSGMSAIRHEPRLRDFYRSLRARGKNGKVAIVAVMRKMLVILNARVRDAGSGPIPA